MSIKTHHSTLSTTSTQWNYQLSTINSYKPSITTQMLHYHKKLRQSKEDFTNNFHRNYIKSKLSLLDIPRANSRSRNPNIFITYQNTHDYNPSVTQEAFPTKQKQLKAYRTINQVKPYTFNPLLSEALDTHHGKVSKVETATQFINKTKAMIKANQIAGYQSEKLTEMNEQITSQLQEIDSRMYMITDCQDKLHYFHKTRDKYINHLYTKLEEEKTIAMSLGNYRSELEKAIKKLNMKINKENILLQNSKQYKIFLILVKCRVRFIEQVSMEELKYYGINQAIAREAFMKRNSIRANININRRNSVMKEAAAGLHSFQSPSKRFNNMRRCSKLLTNESFIPNEETEPLLHNPPIFSSPAEFITHFKKLEEQTLILFNKLNNMIYDSKTLHEDRDHIKKYNNAIDKEDKEVFDSLYDELNKAKEKHALLSRQFANEKAKYEQCASIEVLSKKITGILMNLPFNVEEMFDLPLFYNYMKEQSTNIFINGKRENQSIYAIKALEKVLLYFFGKMTEYQGNMKLAMKLRKIMFIMEKRKRYEKSKHNQMMEIERRNKVNDMIYEKYNKVLFVPRRKLDYKYNRNRNKNNKNLNAKTIDNDLNIAELLMY